VSEQLFNPDFGFFMHSGVDQMSMQINPDSELVNEEHKHYFFFAGRLIGKALLDGWIIKVRVLLWIHIRVVLWINIMHSSHTLSQTLSHTLLSYTLSHTLSPIHSLPYTLSHTLSHTLDHHRLTS
jgi:hypothetical protein